MRHGRLPAEPVRRRTMAAGFGSFLPNTGAEIADAGAAGTVRRNGASTVIEAARTGRGFGKGT